MRPPSRKSQRDRAEEMLALFGVGATRTAKEIAALTGLGPAMTIRHLGRLVQDGRLVATAPPRSRDRAYRRPDGQPGYDGGTASDLRGRGPDPQS